MRYNFQSWLDDRISWRNAVCFLTLSRRIPTLLIQIGHYRFLPTSYTVIFHDCNHTTQYNFCTWKSVVTSTAVNTIWRYETGHFCSATSSYDEIRSTARNTLALVFGSRSVRILKGTPNIVRGSVIFLRFSDSFHTFPVHYSLLLSKHLMLRKSWVTETAVTLKIRYVTSQSSVCSDY